MLLFVAQNDVCVVRHFSKTVAMNGLALACIDGSDS